MRSYKPYKFEKTSVLSDIVLVVVCVSVMSAMASSALCTKVIAIAMVVFLSETVLATRCIERDDQIQRYFISLAPPYDNYYNISKAIYPSVDLPSMLIDITITFLATTTDSDASTNGSTSNQNRPDSHLNITRKYKWSMSCLYVSGEISA